MLRLKNILSIVFGAGLFAFGINYLAIPNHLFEGGVTGITLITYYLFKLPVSIMNLIINFPLFFFAWKLLGKQSLYYSLIGTFSVSGWLAIFEKIESYLEENYQITTAVAQELTGLSAATMRRYLQLFVNQGLLEKSGTTKNTIYSLIIRS